MGWKDLIQKPDETNVFAWVGGRSLRSGSRTWTLEGRLPLEYGWYEFTLDRRSSRLKGPALPKVEDLQNPIAGYLVGDRLIPDNVRVDPDPKEIIHFSETVHLIEPGLDRFVRIKAGRLFENGPLVFMNQEMPLGPEGDVLQAFYDDAESVDAIRGVTPSLDAAFRMDRWQRIEAEKQRLEAERVRREEEEARAREERRQHLVRQLGDGAGRRAMAAVDFEAAARAALAVGGATLLDVQPAYHRNERVVRFRFQNRRFECVCEAATLRIIDAGICLTDHDSGEKGDTYFTLESLPSVIREAIDGGVLVVFRHVN